METKKRTYTPAVLCIALLFATFSMNAQNAVSISASGAVSLDFSTPTEAGNSVVQVTDNSKWLNYNTTVNSQDKKYTINVQLESALPEGLTLKILTSTFQGSWGGSSESPNIRGAKYTDNPGGDSPGVPATEVNLTLLPQVIISDIGTFSTGFGAYLGHQLTYTMSISDYSTVRAVSSNVTVLFTLSEQF